MVAMLSRSLGFLDGGYPVSEAILYVYCDKCGSFNVTTQITSTGGVVLLSIFAVAAFFLFVDIQSLPCILVIGLMSLFLPWKDILLGYECGNCGNQQITESNVLHYQPYDRTVVDVAEELVQKRYVEEDVTGFDQYT
jgi:hypothetical protein